MKSVRKPFRVSTRLKDLIGRDLITDNFVAVFELVKNSFDAHATAVRLVFGKDKLVIADNGKGMSRDDILSKWLFVGYSAKREQTEDAHYTPRAQRSFAGDKGVGRFSCDRLGRSLTLISRFAGHSVQRVRTDWTQFEKDAQREFRDVMVDLDEAERPPESWPALPGPTGTVLEIVGLRYEWPHRELVTLRRGLEKLISPFDSDVEDFRIDLIAPAEQQEDERLAAKGKHGEVVNGPIRNTILTAIEQRTTSIHVTTPAASDLLQTTMKDRGAMVYQIQERHTFSGLVDPKLNVDLYYLNRKAKHVFARRMGLASVKFGSIFLFRNGFRVFPIGEEHDDFYGVNRRKQQGTRRYVGTRELIGRVEVTGGAGFEEATSRNQGLIRTAQVAQLIDCVIQKCVRRLERYVVDITWKDRFDQQLDDTSRMQLDASSASITELVAGLADTKGVELLRYNEDLVRLVDEKSSAFEKSLNALALLAEKTGDKALIQRVDAVLADTKAAREWMSQGQEARREAERQAAKAKEEAETARAGYRRERDRNRFLVAASSLDSETILNLHHQILAHAHDVEVGIKRMIGKLRRSESVPRSVWASFLDTSSFRVRQIITAARFATKSGYTARAVEAKQDIVGYIRDYIELVASLWAPRGIGVTCHPCRSKLVRPFRPIEVGIVIDNLVVNAGKAGASHISFAMEMHRTPSPILTLHVADDGSGWDASIEPLGRAFEKGFTTTDGSGLGLYHVRQVVEDLHGMIELHREPYSEDLDGAYLTVRIGQ